MAEPLHYTDKGQARRVGERTLWTWLAALHKGGVEALEPKKRPKIASSTVLSRGMLDFLISERGLDLYASVPGLIHRARAHNIIGPEGRVDRTLVWRARGRLGLSTRPGSRPNGVDMRRFEHIARMHRVLVDGKHFRAGLGAKASSPSASPLFAKDMAGSRASWGGSTRRG